MDCKPWLLPGSSIVDVSWFGAVDVSVAYILDERLPTSIGDYMKAGLSCRSAKALLRTGWTRLSEISEGWLMGVRNCGPTSVDEIMAWKRLILAGKIELGR